MSLQYKRTIIAIVIAIVGFHGWRQPIVDIAIPRNTWSFGRRLEIVIPLTFCPRFIESACFGLLSAINIVRRLRLVLSVGIGVDVRAFHHARTQSVVSLAFIRMTIHLPCDDLGVELAVVLDGIVVAIGQQPRSELLLAVVAVK